MGVDFLGCKSKVRFRKCLKAVAIDCSLSVISICDMRGSLFYQARGCVQKPFPNTRLPPWRFLDKKAQIVY